MTLDNFTWIASLIFLHSFLFGLYYMMIYALRSSLDDCRDKLECIERNLGIKITITKDRGTKDILVEKEVEK